MSEKRRASAKEHSLKPPHRHHGKPYAPEISKEAGNEKAALRKAITKIMIELDVPQLSHLKTVAEIAKDAQDVMNGITEEEDGIGIVVNLATYRRQARAA